MAASDAATLNDGALAHAMVAAAIRHLLQPYA